MMFRLQSSVLMLNFYSLLHTRTAHFPLPRVQPTFHRWTSGHITDFQSSKFCFYTLPVIINILHLTRSPHSNSSPLSLSMFPEMSTVECIILDTYKQSVSQGQSFLMLQKVVLTVTAVFSEGRENISTVLQVYFSISPRHCLYKT